MKRIEMLSVQQIVDLIVQLEKDGWTNTAIYEYLNSDPKDLDEYFLNEARKIMDRM